MLRRAIISSGAEEEEEGRNAAERGDSNADYPPYSLPSLSVEIQHSHVPPLGPHSAPQEAHLSKPGQIRVSSSADLKKNDYTRFGEQSTSSGLINANLQSSFLTASD